jgi:hypothetical protein
MEGSVAEKSSSDGQEEGRWVWVPYALFILAFFVMVYGLNFEWKEVCCGLAFPAMSAVKLAAYPKYVFVSCYFLINAAKHSVQESAYWASKFLHVLWTVPLVFFRESKRSGSYTKEWECLQSFD